MEKYFKTPELNGLFDEYLKMRKKIKKPATERAIDLAIKNITSFSDGDINEAKRILKKAIFNSNQGIFPLKDYERKLKIYDE